MVSVVAAWPTVALGEVLRKSDEWVEIDPNREYAQVTVRLWGKGVALRGKVQGAEIAASRQLVVHQDQFILSRIDARNGAFGLVPAELDGAVVSSDFPAFMLNEARIIPAFLAWMSKTHGFVELCQQSSEGTTNRVRLQEGRFLAMEVPLPPLDEQRRIVERIEALAARIAQARGLRREAMAEGGSIASRCADRTIEELQADIVRLADLLREDSLNGLGVRPTDEPPGTPILRISAGTTRVDGIVDEGDFKYLACEDETIAKYRLEPGDLLACRFNGNLSNVGRFSLYCGYSGVVQVYPDKLIRFRVDTRRVSPAYVRISMNSQYGRQAIEAFCATTAGNIGISAGNLKTIGIPLPPVAEQESIVAQMDELNGHADRLRRLQAETAAELDALLPAVLDQAFRGEL